MATKAKYHHGLSKHPLYHTWSNIIARCEWKDHKHWRNYGGRGIAICERWRKSFVTFLSDVGERPSPKHTLDRRDNNGNYEPGNVRWATRTEQNRNTRAVRLVTLGGETMSLAAAAERYGANYNAVYRELQKGFPIEAAIANALRTHKPRIFARDRVNKYYTELARGRAVNV